MLTLIPLVALLPTALSLALPDAQTTGPSGGQPLYPKFANFTVYQGSTVDTGVSVNSTYGSRAYDCGTWVGDGTIEAGKCRTFTTQSVGIWGIETEGVQCTLTLYKDSDNCAKDAMTQVVTIKPGEHEVTCVATGVMDGGMYYHGSGIWTCG